MRAISPHILRLVRSFNDTLVASQEGLNSMELVSYIHCFLSCLCFVFICLVLIILTNFELFFFLRLVATDRFKPETFGILDWHTNQ
jgi:hypothetical protein